MYLLELRIQSGEIWFLQPLGKQNETQHLFLLQRNYVFDSGSTIWILYVSSELLV